MELGHGWYSKPCQQTFKYFRQKHIVTATWDYQRIEREDGGVQLGVDWVR